VRSLVYLPVKDGVPRMWTQSIPRVGTATGIMDASTCGRFQNAGAFLGTKPGQAEFPALFESRVFRTEPQKTKFPEFCIGLS
jgi:hypothetical protein